MINSEINWTGDVRLTGKTHAAFTGGTVKRVEFLGGHIGGSVFGHALNIVGFSGK